MPSRHPNVVVCLCDQLRAFEVGCYGHPVVRTPNIDRLAGEGAFFETACSNSPLCVPARSVLISGQYASTCTGTNSNYVGFPPSRQRVRCVAPTLPETLRSAGYHTALVGKWHVHPAPDLVGFDECVYPHNLHRHTGQTFYGSGAGPVHVPGFSLDYEMEHVRRVVRQDRSRPFFLLYSISPPHMPLLDAPERYTGMYTREQVSLRPNAIVGARASYDARWMRLYLWDYMGYLPENLQGDEAVMNEDYDQRGRERPLHGLRRVFRDVWQLMDDPEIGPALRRKLPYAEPGIERRTDLTELYRLYYGMTTCVDDYVGRLMATLREAGVEEETLVVFTSDHGDMLGSHGLWNKAYVYEESIRIPLVFHWPGRIGGGRRRAAIGTLVDVMPTVLGLAGVGTPGSVQGTDLSAVLTGDESTVGPNVAFIEAWKRQIAVRSLDTLYGIPMEGEVERCWTPAPDERHHMYYRLGEDPYEMRNRATEGGVDEHGASLRDLLLDWRARTPWGAG